MVLRVREAELVDVPAVARLLTAEGVRRHEGTASETDQSALRLMLAHVALESGAVWVAREGADGALLGVAVWRPPGAAGDETAYRGLLLRELGRLPQPSSADENRTALRAALPELPQAWLLLLMLSEDDGGPSPLLGPLLTPGLRATAAGTVFTVAASAAERARLAPFGFRPAQARRLPSGAEAWIAVRRPGSL